MVLPRLGEVSSAVRKRLFLPKQKSLLFRQSPICGEKCSDNCKEEAEETRKGGNGEEDQGGNVVRLSGIPEDVD